MQIHFKMECRVWLISRLAASWPPIFALSFSTSFLTAHFRASFLTAYFPLLSSRISRRWTSGWLDVTHSSLWLFLNIQWRNTSCGKKHAARNVMDVFAIKCHIIYQVYLFTDSRVDSYVGDIAMLVTEFWCWWHLLNVGARKLMFKYSGWPKWAKRHQHLIVVTNTFRLKHMSLTSM